MSDKRVTEVRGTITLDDGTTSEFTIGTDGGWQQWGAMRERLGESVGIIEAMTDGLLDSERLASDTDAGDECPVCGSHYDDDGGCTYCDPLPAPPCDNAGDAHEHDGRQAWRYPDGSDLCDECAHNARRSGWDGEA